MSIQLLAVINAEPKCEKCGGKTLLPNATIIQLPAIVRLICIDCGEITNATFGALCAGVECKKLVLNEGDHCGDCAY
jgi:hypothetical protein